MLALVIQPYNEVLVATQATGQRTVFVFCYHRNQLSLWQLFTPEHSMDGPLPECHLRIFREDYVLHSDVSENYVADDNNSVPSGCESVFAQGPPGSVAGSGGN